MSAEKDSPEALPHDEETDLLDTAGPLEPERKAERARNKKARARQELRQRFMANLMSSRDGREWVWDLLSKGHVFASSFVPGDQAATAFKEGERNLALQVLAEIPPDAMKQMLEESADYDA